MKAFAIPIFIYILDQTQAKLHPEAIKRLFLGYLDNSKKYMVWDLNKCQLVVSCHFLFL
jgi:hypothetical protein